MTNDHLIEARTGHRQPISITPASAGWRYLDVSVHDLLPGHGYMEETGNREVLVVPVAGSGVVRVEGRNIEVERASMWEAMPTVIYVPPGRSIRVSTTHGLVCAISGAPAHGRYPTRVIEPTEMKTEIKGTGATRRQVNHLLAPPLPAERLSVYEVYVPGGSWAGWPPHRHDGHNSAPLLDEAYYYRLDPISGFVLHRNWDDDGIDETLVASDGDAVLATRGFHTSVTSPGSTMYVLASLAGDATDDERATPPLVHPDHTEQVE